MEEKKFIRLDELKRLCKNDLEFEEGIIKTFISELSDDVEKVNDYFAKQEWNSIYMVAHKMKPTLHIIEINELLTVIFKIEEYSKWKSNLDEMPKLISELNDITIRTISELNIELKKYKKSVAD